MERPVLALVLFAIMGTVYADDDRNATSTMVPVSSGTSGHPTTMENPTSTATELTTSIGQSSAKVETTAGPTTTSVQTTTPSSTGKTTVAPPPPEPAAYASLNQYTVVENNLTCLLANMTVAFVKQPHNVVTNVTDIAKVDTDRSSCGKLTVTFGNNSFSLVFQNDSKSSSYHLDEVLASINKENANATGLKLGHTSIMASYVCVSGFNVTLNNGLTFVGTNIQFQAFGVEKEKFATAQVCVADIGNNIIIPIAVGCAVAGLIILVIIAYMIGRRRMKHRYEAM